MKIYGDNEKKSYIRLRSKQTVLPLFIIIPVVLAYLFGMTSFAETIYPVPPLKRDVTTEEETVNRPVVWIDSVIFTGSTATVMVSGKNANIIMYYLMVQEAGKTAPEAEALKENGMKNKDGVFLIPQLTEGVEYEFFAAAMDDDGVLSKVVSKAGTASLARNIEIMGKSYSGLQSKEEIADCTNTPVEITINGGNGKKVNSIEYIIADTFVSSEGMIEAIAVKTQDVTTTDGTSSVNFSKWSRYDPNNKPTLIKNMVNYIYVKITDGDGNIAYISSKGIWEDETLPLASKIEDDAKETSAEVLVEGSDDESGILYYYLLVKDPIDVSTVDSQTVKKKGMKNTDGKFKVTGLSKRTRYELFAVTEDKAGNISEVKSGTMTTAGDPSAASVPGGSSKPSSAPGSSSNVAERTEDISIEDVVGETTQTGVPYIESATEGIAIGKKTSGWEKISSEARDAITGSEMVINMNGNMAVPDFALEAIEGRDVNYYLKIDDQYTIMINGLSVLSNPRGIDVRIKRKSEKISSELITRVAGVYPYESFSLNEDDFGFGVSVAVNLGEVNAGRNVDYYSYDETENSLDSLQTFVADDKGIVIVPALYKTDYLMVIRGSSKNTTEEIDEPVVIEADAGSEFANEPRGSNKVWIFVVTTFCAFVCITILLLTGNKKDKK